MKKIAYSMTVLVLVFCFAYAGTSGKISGLVTDVKSGDPLVGVNVVVDGSRLGAATDMNGYYVILNVPPGRYLVKAFMIGYTNINVTDVVVAIDQTTLIDIKLTTEVLAMAEVTVMAERPVIVQEISHSQLKIEAETIETMPVTDITQVIGLQAGVEGMSIRGGSSSETSYIVDGFVMNDERSNIPYTSVSLSTVKEVTIQTGGFNAEYGNVRSGVINIITDEGDPNRYEGTITINYRQASPKHFGISPYDPESYFLRPYLDPDVCWTGTAGEEFEDLNSNKQWDAGEPYTDFNQDGSYTEWDSHTKQQYPSFMGWNAISDGYMSDKVPSNDLSPEAAKKKFEWEHRRQGDIKKPDYTIDLNFGGPVPFISKSFGNLRFNFSYRDLQDMLIYPLSRDSYAENVARLKLTSDISDDMKLSFTSSYGEIHSVSQYNWRPTPTGTVLRSDYTIANMISAEALYVPGYYSPTVIYRTMFGLKFNHLLSSRTFYEVTLQNLNNRYNTFQIADRDSTLYTPIPGYPDYYVDEAPYGYYGDDGINSIGDNARIGGWMNLGRDKSVISTSTVRFELTSQINSTNQIRTGFELVVNNHKIKSFTVNPGMTTWNRKQVYKVTPYRLGIFIHDKMEFKGLIANMSLRMDLTDANTDYYQLDPYDNYFKTGQGGSIETEAPSERSEKHLTFSPRIGISHPITANSKLYFNYGHYLSEPSSTSRFRIQREYNEQVTDIGNPNLLQERTVSYELGYSHNLFEMYLLNLSAYYKNITNQVGWISYESINTAVDYIMAENNNYEDIRGTEVTLEKKYGKWITGFVNYTYMINTNGYFGILEYYENPTKQREYQRENEYQSRPVPRPYARASIDLHSPERFGLKLGGFYPIGGINVNLLATWKAGSYSTYNPNNKPGVVNNVQWRDSYNIDLRLTKKFKINNLDMLWYLDVSNLLNTKFLSYTGFSDSQDYEAYRSSLHFDWEEGIQSGEDRVGVYREEDVDFVPMRNTNRDILDLQQLGETVHYDGSGAVFCYEGYPVTDIIYDESGDILKYEYGTQKIKQYSRYNEAEDLWEEVSKSTLNKLLDDKAYVDMPNIRSMTYLYPREIKFGIQISF